jgi:hypothetical protein
MGRWAGGRTFIHPSSFEEHFHLTCQPPTWATVSAPRKPPPPPAGAARPVEVRLLRPALLRLIFIRTAKLQPEPTHVHPSTLPLSMQYAPDLLVTMCLEAQDALNRSFVAALVKARSYGFPSFLADATVDAEGADMLVCDVSPQLFATKVQSIPAEQFVRLGDVFQFVLPQLHHVSDFRLCCHCFLAGLALIARDPEATIRAIFRLVPSVLNFQTLLHIFSAEQAVPCRYVRVGIAPIDDLYGWLLQHGLATQLTAVCKSASGVLAAQQRAIADAIDGVLPAVAAQFPQFVAAGAADARLRIACISILQLLIDFHDDAWFTVFGTANAFFAWFSNLSEIDHAEYGKICVAVSRSQNTRRAVLNQLIQWQKEAATPQTATDFERLAGFATQLMQLALTYRWPIDPVDLVVVVTRTCQAITANQEPCLRLLVAISRYYIQQCDYSRAFTDKYFDFRHALCAVCDQPLDLASLNIALAAVKQLFRAPIAAGDHLSFAVSFMRKITKFMASTHNAVRSAAWSVFGNWLLHENIALEVLKGIEYIRTALSGLVGLAPGIPDVSARILLILTGFVEHPLTGAFTKVKSEKRARKVKKFFTRIISKEKTPLSQLIISSLTPEGRVLFETSPEALRCINELSKRLTSPP